MDDKNTILCRCEDLTREDILKCIQDGYRTIDEIKRVTRAGMGPCQGRTCRMLIALYSFFSSTMNLGKKLNK